MTARHPITVTANRRQCTVYFHPTTGVPSAVVSTIHLGGVPHSSRRLPMSGPTARAAIAMAQEGGAA